MTTSWSVVAGRSVVDPVVVQRLVDQRIRLGASPPQALAPREREVLREMAESRTNAAIGGRLHLSGSAIGKDVNAIFIKLGLGTEQGVSRPVAAVLAYLRGDPIDRSCD